jgi:hypothetical protein
MVGELIRVFSERGYEIHGALAMEGGNMRQMW